MESRRRTGRLGMLLLLATMPVGSCTSPERSSDITEVEEMEPAVHPHHGIDYIEFVVTDMGEAQRFYGEAFGWKFTDYGPEYAGIQGDGREVGRFRLDTANSVGGPLVILFSNDLELSVTKVRDAGGKIVREPFGFPGGRRFQFLDPSGNELAIWAEE